MACSTTTTTTTTCKPGLFACEIGCLKEIDASCVIYTGENLTNIGVTSGMYLDEILAALDALNFTETVFVANDSSSVSGTTGGTNGHSPIYDVKLDPSSANIMTVSSAGLLVNSNTGGDGKVKVDASDTKDYLENQLAGGTSNLNIMTVTPVKSGGVMVITPTFSVWHLMNAIENYYLGEFCEAFSDCAARESEP
jgi:hypothetical protein